MANEAVLVGGEKVQRWLQQIINNSKKPATVKGVIGIFSANFQQDYDDHFKKKMGPSGRWKSWSKGYARQMRAKGKVESRNLLMQTRHLYQGLKSRKENKSTIEWFNNAKTKKGVPYAWAHNEGQLGMPERKFMWISTKALKKMAKEIWLLILKDSK